MTNPSRQEATHRKPWYRILCVQVLIAVFLGIVVGYLNPALGKSLKPLGDGFINLVKMIIAPIIFCTVVHGIVLMTVVSIPLLDRVGRRPLLLASLGGMTLSLAALGLGFAVGGVALKWVGVLSLAVYIASFAFGLGPVFWLLISEIFPLNVRGQAASVATMACWLSNFLVSLTFLTLLNRLGSVSTFLLYAVLSLAGLWFCFRFVPETKGVPLERIERDLRAGRPLRLLGKTP